MLGLSRLEGNSILQVSKSNSPGEIGKKFVKEEKWYSLETSSIGESSFNRDGRKDEDFDQLFLYVCMYVCMYVCKTLLLFVMTKN